jgi:type IV pilus assembly protein PilF
VKFDSRIAKRLFMVFVSVLLSACISTQSSVFTNARSEEEAVAAQVQLARAYMGKGNWERAKRKLKVAHSMSPDAPEVQEALALVNQNTGEYELAEYHFKRALSLQKQFSRARNNYAAFLYQQERIDEACDQLAEVVKDTLYELRAQSFFNLARCRHRQGRNEDAEKAFLRVVAMDVGSSPATLELAALYFMRGDTASAIEYYGLHRSTVRTQSARALWLGIQLNDSQGKSDAVASGALALRSLYPNSAEYAEYEKRYASP